MGVSCNNDENSLCKATVSYQDLQGCWLALQVTYKRLQETLQQLSGPGTDSRADLLPGYALIDVMFGSREPRFAAKAPIWKAVNGQLDASQQAAVGLALKAQDIALIHGPPGMLLIVLQVTCCACGGVCQIGLLHEQQMSCLLRSADALLPLYQEVAAMPICQAPQVLCSGPPYQ